MKNDITYEYRVFTNRLIDIESMEVGKCTSKVIKELKQKDKVDGRFFHTSDTDEWFFCWNGKLQKLNFKGNSDVNAALAEVEKLIADANTAIEDANKTAAIAGSAASDAIIAANVASEAVKNIENKADKSEVETVSNAVETLTEKVNAIKIPSLDSYATKEYVGEEIAKIEIPEVPSIEGLATKEYVGEEISKLEIPSMENVALKSDIPSLDGYAKLTDIPTIPEIPSLDNYYTKEQIDAMIGVAIEKTNTILDIKEE